MKKIVILVVLVLAASMAFAASPDYFAFEIASGGAVDLVDYSIYPLSGIGFNYAFSDTFAGGFQFYDINAQSIDTLSLSVAPSENIHMTMYSGQVGGAIGFGAGVAYDIFSNTENLFTALSVALDWYASNGGAFDIAAGGVFVLGLKTKVGL